MKNFRDIEQLSAYLDGQLSPSDSARLESRISADPELASVLSDLRAARSILRKLPARKAPRNFTLTRKMVGLKPPLPRTFSFFRLSTAFATFLLMLTFAANSVIPRIGFGAAAPMAAQEAYGIGGGGSGGGCEEPCIQSLAVPTEAPVATEAPAAAELAPLPTEGLPSASEDTARVGETAIAAHILILPSFNCIRDFSFNVDIRGQQRDSQNWLWSRRAHGSPGSIWNWRRRKRRWM